MGHLNHFSIAQIFFCHKNIFFDENECDPGNQMNNLSGLKKNVKKSGLLPKMA